MDQSGSILGVVKVHYSEGHKHIAEVEAFIHAGGRWSKDTSKYSRQAIVMFLDRRQHAFTYFSVDGHYKEGAEIKKLASGFIRTDSDDIAADNLENLPEY